MDPDVSLAVPALLMFAIAHGLCCEERSDVAISKLQSQVLAEITTPSAINSIGGITRVFSVTHHEENR